MKAVNVTKGYIGIENNKPDAIKLMTEKASQYSNIEASVGAIKAGVDILLCPLNYKEAFDALVEAVQRGEITEARIDESVRRILRVKYARSAWPRYVR